MRLKTFTAATVAEAMDLVRREMGEEAIIVSTQPGSDGRGARVVAAIEELPRDFAIQAREEEIYQPPDLGETIRHALSFHGTPPRLIDRLVQAALDLEATDPILAFAGALDTLFTFRPIAETAGGRPIMLVGTPGSGKTITTAKLAARGTLAGQSVTVVTTDTRRAGGIEQLAAFTRILGLELATADTVEEMRQAVAKAPPDGTLLIDTAGINPFSDTEMDTLTQLIRVSEAEPVLVLPAGGDAMESADIAACFAHLGASRLLVTRLDMARRVGSILAAADAGRLMFCNVSITPHVADGLSPINPVSLARLIMPRSDEHPRIEA
ncbi:MAG: GTP-binding protein [Magnetospirillum sp. WYHS-4]